LLVRDRDCDQRGGVNSLSNDSYPGFFSCSIKMRSLWLDCVYANLWAKMSIGLDSDWTGFGL